MDATVDEKIDIQFARPLARKFLKPADLLRIFGEENQFWQPPTFLTLAGPIRRPLPTVDPLIVTALGGQAALGRPGRILLSIPKLLLGSPKEGEDDKRVNPLNPFDLLRTVIPGID